MRYLCLVYSDPEHFTILYWRSFFYGFLYHFRIPHPIRAASATLATVPARVASSAPVRVWRVFVTLAARKYTLMV